MLKNPFSKRVVKFIIAIAAIAVILLLGYWLLRMAIGQWAAILFYGYLVVATLIMVVSFINVALVRKVANPQFSMLFFKATTKTFFRDSFLRTAREIIAVFVNAIAVVTFWPMILFDYFVFASRNVNLVELPEADKFRAQVEMSVNPSFRSNVLFLLAVVVLSNVSIFLGLFHEYYGRLFFILLVIHIVAQHVSYLINSTSLVQQLKVSIKNPYITFFIIGASHVASIILLLNVIINPLGVDFLTYSNLRDIAVDLFSFKKLKLLAHGNLLPFNQYFLSFVGVVLYLSLFRTLFNLKKLHRTDDDYKHIALSLAITGRFNDSLKWLSRARSKNETSYLVRIIALTGVNQIEEAYDSMNRLVSIMQDKKPRDFSISFCKMCTIANMAPLPRRSQISLIKKGMALGLVDKFLAVLISTLPIDPHDLVDVLDNLTIKEKYPLSYCWMLFANDRFDQLRTFLPSFTVEDESSMLIYEVFQLLSTLTSQSNSLEEKKTKLDRWCDNFFGELSNRMSSEINVFDRGLALGFISASRELIAEMLPDRLEECDYYLNKLKSHHDPMVEKFLKTLLDNLGNH